MSLRDRDTCLSELSGTLWPFEPLLMALNISPTAEVLDVGAGDGELLKLMQTQEHQGQLIGIDPVPNAGVLVGTATALPFAAASFDIVFMVRMLSHLQDQELALQEARRVLRPGGLLVVAAHGERHLASLWRSWGQPLKTTQPHLADFARQDIRRAVTLNAEANTLLASRYGMTSVGQSRFPQPDELHLLIWTQQR